MASQAMASPPLPPELQDMVIDLALRDESARPKLLATLRAVSPRLHAFASLKLYAHVALVATHVPVYGPFARRPMPSSPRYREYQRAAREGLKLNVVAPSGRRIPGIEWNGGDGARRLCVERLAAHCTALDGENNTYMTTSASAELAELADLNAAFAGVKTYRQHSLHPFNMNVPDVGFTTAVALVNVPNSTTDDGLDAYRRLGRQEGYEYLRDAGSVCSILAGGLPSSVGTAVFYIEIMQFGTSPYVVHLDECAGLKEVVFILLKSVNMQVLGGGGPTPGGDAWYGVGLGVIKCLVLAVAKARQVTKVTFVGLDELGSRWISAGGSANAPEAQSDDNGSTRDPFSIGGQAVFTVQTRDEQRLSDERKRERAAKVQEHWHRRRVKIANAIMVEILRDYGDAEDQPPQVEVLSLAEFKRDKGSQFYNLCTAQCIYSRY